MCLLVITSCCYLVDFFFLYLQKGEATPNQITAIPELTIPNETTIPLNEKSKNDLESNVATEPQSTYNPAEAASPTIHKSRKENIPAITSNEATITAIQSPFEEIETTNPINETHTPISEKASEPLGLITEPSDEIIADRIAAPDNISNLTILVNGEFEEKSILELIPNEGCFGPPPLRIGLAAGQLMQAAPNTDENLITGFYGGVVFQYDLNKSWLLSTGIGYTYRDGHFDVSKSNESRKYRFGLEEMENQMRPTSLHYVSMPISAGWKKGHHVIEGGVVLDYLAGVRGAIGSIERIDPDQTIKEFVAREKGWITEDGFTRFNVSPGIGYRYRVNQEWSFGLSAQYAMQSITDQKPEGYILQEDDRLQLRLQAVYLFK